MPLRIAAPERAAGCRARSVRIGELAARFAVSFRALRTGPGRILAERGHARGRMLRMACADAGLRFRREPAATHPRPEGACRCQHVV